MGLSRKTSAILKIILFLLIFLIIYIYLLVKQYRTHILDNWSTYRENPFILLFAGFLRKDGEKRSFIDFTKYNFQAWFWNLCKTFFSYLIKPIQYILNLITKIIKGFTETLDSFRAQAKVIRKMFADIVTSTAEKMTNSYNAIQFYQARLQDLMKRQQAMFQIVLYFTEAMRMTLSSLINGPVIGMVQFLPVMGIILLIIISICIICGLSIPFVSWVACPVCAAVGSTCFQADTPITLTNRVVKPISLIGLDDHVQLGGQVISTFKIYIGDSQADIYKYHDIIVSGSHLTFEDHRPIRIDKCSEAELLNNNPDYIYCLNTENHLLSINNRKFSDFHECSDEISNQLAMRLVIDVLNGEYQSKPSQYDREKTKTIESPPVYQWGLAQGTLIKMLNGEIRPIEDIKIGEEVNQGGKVYGVVKHRADYLEMYSYQTDNYNLILSGTQAIKHQGRWKRAYQINDINKINYDDYYAYHLITRNHLLETSDNVILTDYLEVDEDHPVFDKIHEINQNSVTVN